MRSGGWRLGLLALQQTYGLMSLSDFSWEDGRLPSPAMFSVMGRFGPFFCYVERHMVVEEHKRGNLSCWWYHTSAHAQMPFLLSPKYNIHAFWAPGLVAPHWKWVSQHLGAQSNKDVFVTLDPSSARTPSQGAIRQCIVCDLQQPPRENLELCRFKRSKQDHFWT